MKKLPFLILSVLTILITSCFDESTWDKYREWREANDNWLVEQQNRLDVDGSLYFTKLIPVWDPEAYVLIHYFNERSETEGNLSPLFTSTVDVKYIGRLYNDEPFDSSYLQTDSIYRAVCGDQITGWVIALEDMRVGDTCQVIVPYQQGYGEIAVGVIDPYSNLVFNMKLVDIPYYETYEPDK